MSYITTTHRSRIVRWATVALVIASLALPAGAAGFSDAGGGSGATSASASNAPVPPQGSEPSGFSWGDAGVGAGAVAGFVALIGTGLAIRRRGHTSTQPVT